MPVWRNQKAGQHVMFIVFIVVGIQAGLVVGDPIPGYGGQSKRISKRLKLVLGLTRILM